MSLSKSTSAIAEALIAAKPANSAAQIVRGFKPGESKAQQLARYERVKAMTAKRTQP